MNRSREEVLERTGLVKACPNGRKQQVQRPRGRGGVGPERSGRGQWILEVTAGALG